MCPASLVVACFLLAFAPATPAAPNSHDGWCTGWNNVQVVPEPRPEHIPGSVDELTLTPG